MMGNSIAETAHGVKPESQIDPVSLPFGNTMKFPQARGPERRAIRTALLVGGVEQVHPKAEAELGHKVPWRHRLRIRSEVILRLVNRLLLVAIQQRRRRIQPAGNLAVWPAPCIGNLHRGVE